MLMGGLTQCALSSRRSSRMASMAPGLDAGQVYSFHKVFDHRLDINP